MREIEERRIPMGIKLKWNRSRPYRAEIIIPPGAEIEVPEEVAGALETKAGWERIKTRKPAAKPAAKPAPKSSKK
jgi:hypothetical protein